MGVRRPGGRSGANVPSRRGLDFPKRSSPKSGGPEIPPVLLQEEPDGQEERRKRRGVCAQRLKFDKVFSDHKPEQGVCVLGVLGSGKGGGTEGQSGSSAVGKGLSPEFANPYKGVPACWAPSRDQAVLVAGSSGGRARLSSPLNPAPKHEPLGFFHLHPGHRPGSGSVTASCPGTGGGVGWLRCSFPPSRRTLLGGAEASSPARRLKPSISPFAC